MGMRNGSYLVGVKVEFLPLAVRFLFVGGTKTIPPDVMIASIIMIAVCDDLEQLLTDAIAKQNQYLLPRTVVAKLKPFYVLLFRCSQPCLQVLVLAVVKPRLRRLLLMFSAI